MTDAVAEGLAAWNRIKDRTRATWDDWLCIGRALHVGRAECMKAASTNRPVGTRYNRKMGEWLTANGLADVIAPDRYKILLILENIDAIERWRATLNEDQRRRWNHPNCVWIKWQKAKVPRHHVTTDHVAVAAAARSMAGRGGKPICWSQDAMRRAHRAMLDSRSNDLLTLARVALEAAIRNEADLLDLLNETPPKAAPAKAAHAVVMA